VVPSDHDLGDSLHITEVRLGRYEGADRFVVEFDMDLEVSEVSEVEELRWEDGLALAVGDDPHSGECVEHSFADAPVTFVNLQVPSDYLYVDSDIRLDPAYRSDDHLKVTEVGVCPPYEGRALFSLALSESGEVDAFILDDPGRVVVDVR
jgi:hypothetical protein